MKYENLKQVGEIAKDITKHEKLLADLGQYENGQIKLVIIGIDSKTITTVGVHKSFEHQFSTLAEGFIADCIELTTLRINQLKGHLEKL